MTCFIIIARIILLSHN